jgi:hypothetical protein
VPEMLLLVVQVDLELELGRPLETRSLDNRLVRRARRRRRRRRGRRRRRPSLATAAATSILVVVALVA